MNPTLSNATKGSLAAGAALLLLLGGGGTLASWTEDEPVTGGAVNAGHLNLVTDATNTGCGAWTLDTGESAPSTYAVGDPIVPGDVISKTCAFTIDAVGNHLRATVGIDSASFSGTDGDFAGALTAQVGDLLVDGTPATSFTEDDDGSSLAVTVSVTFDSAAGNGTEDLATVLDDLTVTATQVHS